MGDEERDINVRQDWSFPSTCDEDGETTPACHDVRVYPCRAQ